MNIDYQQIAYFFISFILIIFALNIVYYTYKQGIGPTPSSRKVKKYLFGILPDKVNGDIVELGCGWGGLIPLLKKKYPKYKVYAYEQTILPFICSYLFHGKYVIRKDFFKVNLDSAGLIICYLCRQEMKKIATDIFPYLQENCWLVTHTFELPGYSPELKIFADDLYKTPIYLYKKM